METTNSKEYEKNPILDQMVEPENDLKNMLVEYVGEKLNPEDMNVTVEMIVDVMAKEFPEFVLALAEENWVRGYQQGLVDVEAGMKIAEEQKNGEKRSCKLCED
mgnify:FL=1